MRGTITLLNLKLLHCGDKAIILSHQVATGVHFILLYALKEDIAQLYSSVLCCGPAVANCLGSIFMCIFFTFFF